MKQAALVAAIAFGLIGCGLTGTSLAAVYYNGFGNSTSSITYGGSSWHFEGEGQSFIDRHNENGLFGRFWIGAGTGDTSILNLRNDTNNFWTTFQASFQSASTVSTTGQVDFAFTVRDHTAYLNDGSTHTPTTYIDPSDLNSGVGIGYGGTDAQHLWGCIADTQAECDSAQTAANLSPVAQYKSDAITTIGEGSTTTDNTVVFAATLTSGGTSTLQLQIEVQPAGSNNFTGTPNVTSTFVSPGNEATATYSLAPEVPSNGSYHWQARVFDGSSYSAWHINGITPTATDFIIKTVPLYTQIGSDYPSFASSSVVDGGWAGDIYDDGSFYCGGGNTIGYCGCAITSVVMDLRYFGITTDTSGTPVDPRGLNTWLTTNNGYTNDGVLDWGAISHYASSSSGGVITLDPNSGQGYGSTTAEMAMHIDPLLTSSTPIPVIFTETPADHFVVATGKAQNNGTSTYTIRDSAWYLTQYFNQTTSTDTSSTINGYDNEADGVHIYYDPPQIPRTNTYAINLPNALMLVDSQGRRTGRDPATGIYYHEIPGTQYEEDRLTATHGSGELTAFSPADGLYTLYILGGGTGQYHLDSWVDDGGVRLPTPKRLSGSITDGSLVIYSQIYNTANIPASIVVFSGNASSTTSVTSVPPHNLPPPPIPPPPVIMSPAQRINSPSTTTSQFKIETATSSWDNYSKQ